MDSSNISIQAPRIEQIDNLNKTGTLDRITFYQGQTPKISKSNDSNSKSSGSTQSSKTNNSKKDEHILEKSIALSLLDSESENEEKPKYRRDRVEKILKEYDTKPIETTVITPIDVQNIRRERIESDMDSSIILESDNVNLLYYSHYFGLDDKPKKFILNIKDLIKEICLILFIHLFLGIHDAIFNVITIDGILSSIIFYMIFYGIDEKNNFLLKNRLILIDRYIYYFLLFCGYYIFNFVTWYMLSNIGNLDITMYAISIMICPNIMGIIYDIQAYKKVRNVMYDGYNKLIQKIICKQLSKIINIIIKNVLNLDINVGYEDLIPFYSQFSWLIINKFIITFIIACIFNHIDKGGMKFPMMIYKNIYMKDTNYNISDDKLYLTKIIKDKQYAKFMDVYTLNRIIRMVVTDDAQNSMLSDQVTAFLKKLVFKINRIIFCWTLMSISNLTYGILGFFLFIWSSEKPLRYLLNTLFFTLLSYYTDERLLVIILCEIFYPIIESKLLIDIVSDTYQSFKRGFLGLYDRTRLESILLSIGLTYLSYVELNNIGIFIVCILNLIVMFRMYMMNISLHISDIHISKIHISQLIQYPVNILSQSIIFNKTNIKKKSSSENIQSQSPTTPISHIPKTTPIINIRPMIKKIVKILSPPVPTSPVPASPVPTPSIPVTSTITTATTDESAIFNKDILIIIREKVVDAIKNNLLVNAINPFNKIDTINILKVFMHLFFLLIFGYISNFYKQHILLLPIIIQNIVDLLI